MRLADAFILHFMSFCFPWESTPWPWHWYRCALLFELLAASFVCINVCSLMCVCVFSVLHPGSECADGQSVQWITPAGGSSRSAAHRSTAGHRSGKSRLHCLQCSWMVFQVDYKAFMFLSVRQLTAKNIQCMRTLLNLAHCHGAYLGTSWQLVLATLQVQAQ